jgi:hypothetical protein
MSSRSMTRSRRTVKSSTSSEPIRAFLIARRPITMRPIANAPIATAPTATAPSAAASKLRAGAALGRLVNARAMQSSGGSNQIKRHLSDERPKEPKTGRDIEIREIGRKPIPTENPVLNA